MSRNFALVVSAGTGQRFGQIPPKQFSTVNGQSVLEISLRNIHETTTFSGTFVAVPKDYMDLAESTLRKLGSEVTLIEGGRERRDSILRLLRSLQSNFSLKDLDVITIFDANRPLTSKKVILTNIENARQNGVSCPTLPLVNGVATVEQYGFIVSIPNRSQVVQIVTPESARWDFLVRRISTMEKNATIAGLAELSVFCGEPVPTVPSDKFSMKITNPEDWDYFLQLLREKRD